MVLGTNLFAINERASEYTEGGDHHMNSGTKATSYNKGLYNPLNAASVYIKSTEFIYNILEILTTEMKEVEKLTKSTVPNAIKALYDKRKAIYRNFEKVLKIIEEFRKGFSLSEEQEAYAYCKYLDERFVFLDERINLAYTTSKTTYLEEAKIVTNHLKTVFIKLQETMQELLQAERALHSPKQENNEVSDIMRTIVQSDLKAGSSIKYSI